MSLENNKKIIEREEALAHHEVTPKNRLENQIRLATDLYQKINGEVDVEDLETRNSIMFFWSNDPKGYSASYRKLEESDWFKIIPT